MKQVICYILFFAFNIINVDAQDGGANTNAAPLSGGAMAASRMESVPINYYTGIPSISIPLYNYTNQNGLSLNMSLNYFAGGIKVNEAPSTAGLGWNLNVGGAITRTLRGMPDDFPTSGFLYQPSGTTGVLFNYNRDCLDGEQDIFQFNFNGRSGKFFIGKNKQIVVVPAAKLKIGFTRLIYADTAAVDTASIQSFNITTEDGVKYVFNGIERQYMPWPSLGVPPTCSFYNHYYTSAWYLTQIIAPFGTDTITIKYASGSSVPSIDYPQNVNISQGVTTHSLIQRKEDTTSIKQPILITLPDKKSISFVYYGVGQFRYATYSVLQRIKFSDSIFRYGYMLNWDTVNVGSNKRDFLNGINYYTATLKKPGYTFLYDTPYFKLPELDTNFLNKKDHWGYYNGAGNTSDFVPTVTGIYAGADRSPSPLAIASSLASITDPSGGTTYYQYENNDVTPYAVTPQNVAADVSINTQSSVSLNQILSNQYNFTIALNKTFLRTGTPPVAGAGNLVCTITSTDGSIIYATNTVSLIDLYNMGAVTFNCNISNGNFLFKTSLASGTTVSASLPVNISWNNQSVSAGTSNRVGGLRIKQIRHYDPLSGKMDTLTTYKYVNTDGKSSGFLGTIPTYNYNFYHVGSNPDYTDINIFSDPITNFDYTQGSPVGYGRVEVIRGSANHNLGKYVYEFTNLQDANTNTSPTIYPFLPKVQRDWAMGLPKRTSVFDSTGRLIEVTSNVYNSLIISYAANANFKCIKAGNTSLNSNATGSSNQNFTGFIYYPETGRSDLATTIDSFYHSDNSLQVTRKDIQYDTNYNPVKFITTYDKSRGLSLEKRLYYPYNYTLSGIIGKLRDSSILTMVSSEDWITGDANPRLLSASITDFQQVAKGYIKPLTVYALQNNGPVAQGVIGTFNPALLVRSNLLVPQQNFVRYDSIGNALEVKNALTNQSSTVLMDYNNQYPIAKISNASFSDVAYTSFEADGSGNWSITGAARDKTKALTGKLSYNLSNGAISKTGLNLSTTYIVSYWMATGASVIIAGAQNILLIAQQNGWNLYTQTITNTTSVSVSGTGLVDELRLYPKDANMATNTYEPTIGVTSTCDANNEVTYFQYDSLNRIIVTRDKDMNVIKKYEYPNNNTSISTMPNWVATGQFNCDYDITGRVDRVERDLNVYSETYLTYRVLYDHSDCVLCKGFCSDPLAKSINCICEMAVKTYTASVYQKISGTTWGWVCTWHWGWSDGSKSTDYREISTSSCFNVS